MFLLCSFSRQQIAKINFIGIVFPLSVICCDCTWPHCCIFLLVFLFPQFPSILVGFSNFVKSLWLGLPSTLIRHENGDFRKRWRGDSKIVSLPEVTSNTNPKWPVSVANLNSSVIVKTENICVFSESLCVYRLGCRDVGRAFEEFANHVPAARDLRILLVFYRHPAWFISL